MNKNLSNEEFVNSYLDNELSDIDRLDFENKLLKDADLREEYNFQKDLVNGIKEARRMELKSRLSNIPIQTPIYQTIGFKVLTAGVAVSLGIGAYILLNDDNNTPISEIDLSQNKTELVQEYEIPEVPESTVIVVPEKKNKKEKTRKNTEDKNIKNSQDNAVAKNTEKEVNVEPVQPNIIQPDIVDPSDDESFDLNEPGKDNPINNLDNIKEVSESNVTVSTVRDKKNRFHYKFFENKLYLLGNFNDMPYEIIELNSAKGKSYFLYYDESFYKLNTEMVKPAPLVKIENDSLVRELKIIQLNQSN